MDRLDPKDPWLLPSGLPAPTATPVLDRATVLKLHQELLAREEGLRTSEEDKHRKTIFAAGKKFSKYRLNELKLCGGLNTLKCDATAEGLVLPVRIISKRACRVVGIHLVVEDPQGNVAPLQVHRIRRMLDQQSLDDRFPVGGVFAIKEPVLRSNSKSGFLIRIESPADFVPLYPSFPLYSFRFTWTPVNELKEKGNKFYTQKRLEAAYRCYTAAIEDPSCREDPVLLATVLSNRAMTALKLGRSRRTLLDAKRGLAILQETPHLEEKKIDSLVMKLTSRQILALIDREEDHGAYQSLLQQLDSLAINKGAVALADALIAPGFASRHDSATYDWESIYASIKSDPWKPLNIAGYKSSSIKIEWIPGKGVGVVATCDIKRGELILVEKPLASAVAYPAIALIGRNQFTGYEDPETAIEVVATLVELMDDDPDLRERVMTLSSGPAEPMLEPFTEVGIDISRLEAIVTFNAFRLRPLLSRSKSDHEVAAAERPPTAIYYFASRFNHCCLANVSYQFLSTAIMLRAVLDIKKGEEMTLAYTDPGSPYEEREKKLQAHGFVCKCDLCVADRKDGPDAALQRREAMQCLHAVLASGDYNVSAFAAMAADKMKTWYDAGRTAPKCEYACLLNLQSVVEPRSQASLDFDQKAHEALGAEFNGKKRMVKPPLINANCGLLAVGALNKAQEVASKGLKNLAKMWVQRAKMIEEGEAGLELFEIMYRDKLKRIGV